MSHSADASRRPRNGGSPSSTPSISGDASIPMPSESWVEISSQPSSSSLSSIGDEIVTTGLRVSGHHPIQSPHSRRRRVSHTGTTAPLRTGLTGRQMSNSSQEEYSESSTSSEDEGEQVLTSSNEHVPSIAYARAASAVISPHEQDYTGGQSDDDDENSTALGTATKRFREDNEPFTPQPNAFSHPPSSSSKTHRASAPGSYFPDQQNSTAHPPSFHQRRSYPGRGSRQHGGGHGTGHSHGPYSGISPSHDHDAALRASLTTLLSCAAAARGLPKRNQNGIGVAGPSVSNPRPEFTRLRLVPESELTGVSPARSRARSSPNLDPQDRPFVAPSVDKIATTATDTNHNGAATALDKGKRKAQTTSGSSGKASTQKKKRLGAVQDEALISPTLLTWVVSAGVVVLVSVVGFGAGFAMGREVGRQEGMSILASTSGAGESCAREAGRGVSGSVVSLRRVGFGRGRGIVA